MGQPEHNRRSNLTNLIFLVIFGTAFGYVEAAVVYYLRDLINFHTNYVISDYKTILNLGFIAFVSPIHSLLISNRLTGVEIARETATIVMLIAIAYVAGKNKKQRIGAFLVSFACWDIMYYFFLRIIDSWPSSLMTKDVYFLIPVSWIGPVITPIVISTIMLVVGIRLYLKS
jgi:hypothetical protein